MAESSIVLILFGSFLVLLVMGAPVTVSLGVAALASFYISIKTRLSLFR